MTAIKDDLQRFAEAHPEATMALVVLRRDEGRWVDAKASGAVPEDGLAAIATVLKMFPGTGGCGCATCTAMLELERTLARVMPEASQARLAD